MTNPIREPYAAQHLGISAAILSHRGCPPPEAFSSRVNWERCHAAHTQTRVWMIDRDEWEILDYLNECIRYRKRSTLPELRAIATWRDPFYKGGKA